MGLMVKAEVTAGTQIARAAEELIALAAVLGVGVTAAFNGTEVYAMKHDTVDEVCDRFEMLRRIEKDAAMRKHNRRSTD